LKTAVRNAITRRFDGRGDRSVRPRPIESASAGEATDWHRREITRQPGDSASGVSGAAPDVERGGSKETAHGEPVRGRRRLSAPWPVRVTSLLIPSIKRNPSTSSARGTASLPRGKGRLLIGGRKKLAERSGIPLVELIMLERWNLQDLSLASFINLAFALQVSVDHILSKAGWKEFLDKNATK